MSHGWPDSLLVDSRDTLSLLMRSVLTACPLVVLTLYQALLGTVFESLSNMSRMKPAAHVNFLAEDALPRRVRQDRMTQNGRL